MTREELQTLVDQLPMPACVMHGIAIVVANRRMTDLTGFTAAQLTSAPNPILMMVSPEDQPAVMARAAARQRGESVAEEFDFMGQSAGGEKILARARVSRFPLAGPDALLFVFSDERLRGRVADTIRGLVNVAVAAQAEHTQAGFFRVVRERLSGLGLAGVLMEISDGQFRLAPFLEPATEIGKRIRANLPGWTPLERLRFDLTSSEGVLIEDLPAFIAELSGLPASELRGKTRDRGVIAAIHVGGEPRWALAAAGPDLDRAIAGAFGLFARQLGAALDATRRIEELDTRNAELALLNDVARGLAGALELRPLLELGGATLCRLLDCEHWFMMLPDAAGEGLRFYAVQPEHADLAGHVLRFTQPSMAVTAYKEHRAIQLVDPGAHPEQSSREMAARFGNQPTLAAPLIARGECLGVAVVVGSKRTRAYSELEMERAQAVAGQVALALLSARLYEDLRASYGKLARTQKELIDRERLAALGELSASIAHEVRNPLGVIFNSVGTLRRLLKPQGDVALLLDIVGEEADRLNRMVGDLLDYSRPVRPALEPLPIEPLIEEALSSARRQIGAPAEGVKSRVLIASGADTVRADARLLRQALVNLFINAFQAMPRGGQLEVRAARSEHEGALWAEIVLSDSGPGIPAEAREKVFQPFFTTKPTGTGLGLAVVKRIVEGHGGLIQLTGEGSGTEFHVLLPLEG